MTTRSALPQNYITSEGSQIEGFETTVGWSVYGTATPNSIERVSGEKSITLASTTPGDTPYMTKSVSLDLSQSEKITFWVYCHTAPSTTISTLVIYISSLVSGLTQHFIGSVSGANLSAGWNRVQFARNEFSGAGGESWNNTMRQIRFRINFRAGQTASVSFDDLRSHVKSFPRLLITFDDGRISTYTVAYPLLDSRNLAATAYVNGSSIGNKTAISVAQAQELYANGWAIANHSYDHEDLTGLTQSEVEAELALNYDWLLDNDMPRAAMHVAYPGGNRDATVLAAMAAQEMLTGRTVNSALQKSPTSKSYELNGYSIHNTDSLSTVEGYVDTAIQNGYSCILIFHTITESPSISTEWSTSDFTSLLDYIMARKIQCVTIDEWYNGLTNPRYRSLPAGRT